MTKVRGGIKKDGAAFIPNAGAESQQPLPVFSPQHGISEASHIETRRWSGDHRSRHLLPRTQVIVLCNGKALRFAPGMRAVTKRCFRGRRWRRNSGVNHGYCSVVENRAAAEDSILVGTAGRRRQGDGFVMPMQHIGTGGMSPVHVSPNRALRIVLMEHVITTAKINGTIGIIHPVMSGQKMILRSQRIRGKLAAECVCRGILRNRRLCTPRVCTGKDATRHGCCGYGR